MQTRKDKLVENYHNTTNPHGSGFPPMKIAVFYSLTYKPLSTLSLFILRFYSSHVFII